MRALLAPLQELGEYEEIKKMLGKERAAITVSGCVDSEKLHRSEERRVGKEC